MNADRETIFALSSGRPPGAIAVIRISGPRARLALERMIGRLPRPRRATLARLRDPVGGDLIDEGLVLWFPGPTSETGEDTAELHLHGGRAVISATLAVLARIEGFRHAQAGEFSRRAFENGRLDLTAVEGLADLVAAETDAQRRQALGHLTGLLGERAQSWRQRLIAALALVEAGIDFSDQEDVPQEVLEPALALIRPLAEEIAQASASRGERLREGLRVAIAGLPNAGKSTLLNRLARREAAIVTPFPGTTRDVLEVHLDLGGYPVTLLDTAGIRDTEDPAEREGVRRAREQAATADLVLWLLDAGAFGEGEIVSLPKEEPTGRELWPVLNKMDLVDSDQQGRIESGFANHPKGAGRGVSYISAITGNGMDALVTRLAAFAEGFFSAEPAFVARERHRARLEEAAAALAEAQSAAAEGKDEIMAEQLRLATRALDALLGRVDVEDVLDVIFRDFCIGK